MVFPLIVGMEAFQKPPELFPQDNINKIHKEKLVKNTNEMVSHWIKGVQIFLYK